MANIDIQIKELDREFDKEYEAFSTLNQQRVEKEFTMRGRIQKMAEILTKKYTLLIKDPEELEDKLHDICSEICKYKSFADNNHMRQYASDALDERFKRPYNKSQNVMNITIPEEVKTKSEAFIQSLKDLKNNLLPEQISDSGLQDIAQLNHDIQNKIERIADLYKIPLSHQKHSLDELSNPKKEPITLQAAPEYTDPRVRELSQIIIANERTIASLINKGADQLEKGNYLPEDISLLQEYIKSQEAVIASLQPIANTKWLRDLQQWDKIIQVQEEHGTSAASSASKIELYTDSKTNKKHYHKLSFEQISNASEARAKEIVLVKEHLVKYINLRSKILRDKELFYRAKRSDDIGKK